MTSHKDDLIEAAIRRERKRGEKFDDMRPARAAKVVAMSYAITCPQCEEPIVNEYNGSYLFVMGEAVVGYGARVTCEQCGETCKVPKYAEIAR